ncbi:MAG TPA: hypothetical protein ENK96_07030, partial [Desulfobulbaceae bacterium]|nr:hypothetical protein [Desulfobulbaceae bacterium]
MPFARPPYRCDYTIVPVRAEQRPAQSQLQDQQGISRRLHINRLLAEERFDRYFNTEFDYKITPDNNNEIKIADDVLQMDLNQGYPENIEKEAIFRGGKLYDKKKHSYEWTAEHVYVDIVWHFS